MGIDPLLAHHSPLLFMVAVAIVFLRVFRLLVMLAEKVGKYFANFIGDNQSAVYGAPPVAL